jgi:signal peptidase I
MAISWLIAQGIMTYLVQRYEIPSTSMEDTLQIGDNVLVDKLSYRFSDPEPGDLVVFLAPDNPRKQWIKRVVAVGGQTVDIRDGVVYIDGDRLTEPYVNTRYPSRYESEVPVKVPADTVYLMGDNRANSQDSRYIGPQPLSRIVGRAFVICWPIDRARSL